MLFNKNEVRKASEKKVLHKSGKNWIVLSSALLLALAGGAAVSSQTSANADNVNNDTQVEAQSLEANPNSESVAATPSKAASTKSVAAPKWNSNPSLIPNYEYNRQGNNASAALYRRKNNFDNENLNYYGKTVNAYVNRINKLFPTQTSELSSNLSSYQAKRYNDNSLANSYSATAAKPDWSNEVNTLAHRANMPVSAFVDNVQRNASDYNYQISNGASLVSEESVVNSYAQLISAINTNPALQQKYITENNIASAKSTEANAVYNAYSDTDNAIRNAFNTNATNLANNQAAVQSLATNEQVAQIYSNQDASLVDKIAAVNGETNSSAASSAVRSIATSDFNADNINNTSDSGDVVNNNLTIGRYSHDYDNVNDADYILLSDTSATAKYAANYDAAERNITNAKAASVSDSAAVSSADSALASASNASLSASSVYAATAVLATPGVNLGNIFGNNTNLSAADVSTNDRILNPTSYTSAFNDPAMITALNNNDATAVSDVANHNANSYHNVSFASATYAKDVDEGITLASYFATSYSNDASVDAQSASVAKNSLDNFYLTHADATYASAFNSYESASNAEPNDKDLAHAYGINVYKHSPRFITMVKGALVHSNPDFANSKKIGRVSKGAKFEVKGIAFDPAGNIRYVVDNKAGERGYITANSSLVKNTYLNPGKTYTANLNKAVAIHTSLDFGSAGDKVVNKFKSGATVSGVAVRTDTDHGWYGVTRLQINSGKYAGDYITTNDSLVTPVAGGDNNANNATDHGTDQQGTDNMWWN